MPRVLVVDDEEPLRLSLGYQLVKEGFTVTTAADAAQGLEAAESADVIVLDIMLPGMDGMDVCRQIRRSSDVPIVMLTARDDTGDKVTGLDIGADDYVTKPFNTRELIARIHAVLRRRAAADRLLAEDRVLLERVEDLLRRPIPLPNAAGSAAVSHTGVVSAGPVSIDLDSRTVTVRGRPVCLSAPEFGLLGLLVAHQGRVVTRTELIERIWGTRDSGALAMLDGHVRSLRERIEDNPARPTWLVTVPGIGFQFG